LESLYFLGNGHERAGIDIKRHLSNIPEAKLAARAATETENLTSVSCQDHGVDISTGGMDQAMLLKGCYTSRDRLIGIAILICWERRSVWMAKLTTGPSTPRVEIPIGHHSYRVGFAASDLSYFLLLKNDYQFRFRLIRASIFIFRH